MSVDSAAALPGADPAATSALIGWCVAVALFGATVGAAELLSRYRDDPWRSLARREGIAYVLLNSLVSLTVFGLLLNNRDSILPNLSTLWRAIVAGFGSMALLRSKFFTFRSASDEDIPVGIEAAVSAFLQALDRGVDRAQSWRRWDLAFKHLRDIPDQAVLDQLVHFSVTNLRSYQNVPTSEYQSFEGAATELKGQAADPAGLRAIAVGIALQAIAGSDNFVRLATQFRQHAGLPPTKP